MKPVDIVIIGAGDRGNVYASYAEHHPDRARIVGVAEPVDVRRVSIASKHSIDPENVFNTWQELANRDRFADAAVICTQDAMHEGPAVALANQGYHLLLEKPMAPDEEGCRRIVDAAIQNNILFSVGHVLRYTRYTQKLKEILDSGAIGHVISIQRLEPVGYWHQAHSFVRGNWRNTKESTFMLLAKSCHDIDWIRYIMGRKCTAVSSYGDLTHFTKRNKPEQAGDRCVACEVEPGCPYSAMKIYLGFLEKGISGWPVHILVDGEVTKDTIMQALQSGPYGRCVYECDNDVVDHQVVNFEFEGGLTASFTMTAFTRARGRETRIFGSAGEVYGDGTKIHVFDFLTDQMQIYDTASEAPATMADHGGGDYALMHAFVSAILGKRPDLILSGPEETLESHLMTFAAERSRTEGRSIDL